MTSEDQKVLRRKYKINEIDLDQIPGKNRKRKKKRPAPGVRETPSGRSAGSGPKVKTLGLDSYDSSICAICLAPMESVLEHSWNKPAVPSVTPPDLGSTLESILRSNPFSVPLLGPGPAARDTSEPLSAAESYVDCTTSVSYNGDTTNGLAESNRVTVVDLSEEETSSNPISCTQDPHPNPSSTSTEEINIAESSQLMKFTDQTLSTVPTRPPPPLPVDSVVPKYFHRLTCSDCGIHVHLGCVCDTEGATAVASHMLKGMHCVSLHCTIAALRSSFVLFSVIIPPFNQDIISSLNHHSSSFPYRHPLEMRPLYS
jgi:hypothetical protein